MKKHIRHVFGELREHLPYSIFSVATGMVILGLLTFGSRYFGFSDIAGPSRDLFHIFHPLHILFSAIATTAMFWSHEKRILKALLIGSIGSVAICGISDMLIPYFAGGLLGVKMHLHVCIIENPGFILPFVITGVIVGFIMPKVTIKSTFLSHSAHVLISSMASILYLIAFGLTDWIHVAGFVLVYMVLAVIIPCCTSDIIFPLLLTRKK